MEYFGNNLRLKEKRRIEKHNGEAYEYEYLDKEIW